MRLLTTSHTFQLRSSSSPVATAEPSDANKVDPTNRYLSHANIRRLEAEAIRDSMLMVSGRLDLTAFGEPVDGSENRRSVYVQASRNNPDPLLAVFDAPIPTNTKGRRHVTNVPAQALSMMNSEHVHEFARTFASRMKDEVATPEGRIERMIELALGRQPTSQELASAKAFLSEASSRDFRSRNQALIEAEISKLRASLSELQTKARKEELEREEREELNELREVAEEKIEKLNELAAAQDEWYELALAMFCMKEFIYLR